ncbi:MAG: hypothetical protein JXK07_14995 [Spirochaetes bacterium]|nr:hypothetical protein [Spirochaetota bacterium]MBN2772227.1 hypothetical protein [Spirochaetota bacterium]
MAYKEKKTITTIVTGIAVLTAYCCYSFGSTIAASDTDAILKQQAVTMLKFIGIGIVAMIVIQILFHILYSISLAVASQIKTGNCNDKEIEKMIELEVIEDERDKIIELKSLRIGFVFAGIGFVSALVWLVMDGSPIYLLNIIFIAFGLGSILEGFTRLYYYSR